MTASKSSNTVSPDQGNSVKSTVDSSIKEHIKPTVNGRVKDVQPDKQHNKQHDKQPNRQIIKQTNCQNQQSESSNYTEQEIPTIIKGRGAQINTANKFHKTEKVYEHSEGLDEADIFARRTEYLPDFPKTIINRVDSPDIGPTYSLNPYQGCEHGCIYCYARNTHTYWGYSAGLDFESKILVKESAPALLEAEFRKPNWEPLPVMLSGNTDCYQPAEKKYKITRKLLEVFLRYKHPVGIITKNTLIKRDLDLIEALNKDNLVAVNVSLTSLNSKLRSAMEPRTAHPAKRLALIKTLSEIGVPVNVMLAPIIPGLNNSEIPDLVKAAGEAGARSANMIVLRLPGDVALLFTDWLFKHFPDRAEKVLSQVKSIHGGKLYDSRFKVRMRGQGPIAESIHALFKMSKSKYIKGPPIPKLNVDAFIKQGGKQLGLF